MRQVIAAGLGFAVELLEARAAALLEIANHLRPGRLGLSDDDGVGVPRDFFRQHGGVQTAENNRDAERAAGIGDEISVEGAGRIG